MQNSENNYYALYCKTGRRLQIIGGSLLLVMLAVNELTGRVYGAMYLVPAFIGALILLFGFMNMRPNNQIKSFASQLQRTPDRDFAQGLLDALVKNRKTALGVRSRRLLEESIAVYAESPDADAALVDQLRAACSAHVMKSFF